MPARDYSLFLTKIAFLVQCNKYFIKQVGHIGLVRFYEFMDLEAFSNHKHVKLRTWPIPSSLDLKFGQ